MARHVTATGAAMLVARESVRLTPYNDSEGYCTTGIGHLIARRRCTTEDRARWTLPSRDAAVALFRQDLAARYEPGVEAAVKVPLADHQYDALVSLCYNIGVAGLRGSAVVRRLNAGDHHGASTAFMMWNKPASIVGRRRGEMNQFRTPYGSQVPVAAHLIRGPSKRFALADWLHPEFRDRLDRVHAEVPFRCVSGGRSRKRQTELYNAYRRGAGNPANPPGTSWHEFDEDGSTLAQAADIHPLAGHTYAQLQAAGRRHGIHFPVAAEDWHAQPVEAKSSKRVAGQGLGPVPTYWSPQGDDDEEADMGKRYIFGVQSEDPTEAGIWLMGTDEVARHIPQIPDVEALHRIGVPDAGQLSADFLRRHRRVHPGVAQLPEAK